MLKISKKFFYEFAGGRPILIYHRDNPQSQTTNIHISNHLIYSFTRILDYHDKYYYLQPLKWIRHTLGLFHFSISYYGTPFPIFKYLSRASTIIWCILLIPLGITAHFFKKKHRIVRHKNMDPRTCANIIKEVRKDLN